MLKSYFAIHAQITAFVAATLCAVTIFLLASTWVLFVDCSSVVESQNRVAAQGNVIRSTVLGSLRHLNKYFEPVCTDSNLFELRRLQFQTRYVGDFGIFDSDGRLICTSVAGVLQAPLTLEPPEMTMTNPEGDLVQVNFNTRPLVTESRERHTIIHVGRFNAVVSLHVLQDFLQMGISAVQLVHSNGSIRTFIQQDRLGIEWSQRLRSAQFSKGGLQSFFWEERAFVATTTVPGTAYVVQTVLPFDAFIQNHSDLLLTALVVSLLVGFLVYKLLKLKFLSWHELHYRIQGLLTDKNLLCTYQPIINLETLKPEGCEVLMRLHDGNKIIQPDEAIPAIIARNLTWRLDQLVVQVSVAELARQLPALQNFRVAFNFFPANVTSEKIQDLFDNVRRKNPHEGLLFEIEVLEQEYGGTGIIGEVAKLRQLGFLFAVDDFGTGYSNLGSIKAIAPDFLKIDQSFVRDMEDASVRSSLIPEIVSIARAVGAQVIAEGIENEQQMEMLRDMGVDYGQGYYFARPQPIAGFSHYLRTISVLSN
ncbi:MAG: EAL domain-containing protein [Betaproteobacteria bacterium]